MGQKHDIPAVVVGLNVNALAVARALGRNGVPVTVVAEGSAAPEARSRYILDLWLNGAGDEALCDLLLERGQSLSDRPVLFPVTDSSVRAVASHLGDIAWRYRVGMPEPDLVEALLDKRRFAQLALDLGLPAPRTFFVDRPEQMPDVIRRATYPCILKPQSKSQAYQATGAKKAYHLQDGRHLLETYRTFCHAEPRVVVQEWVPGGDNEVHFCLQYYDAQSRPLVSFCGHKIRQWPPHCGGTASCEPVGSGELEALSTAFFQRVGFQGLCSMEFKRDPRDGTFKMIEPTVCRTDWQSGVADINGVPIPYVAYRDLAGLPPLHCVRRQQPVKWVHLSSDRQSADYYRERGELTWARWLGSIRPPVRGAYWALDDPLPYLSVLAGKVCAKLVRVGRRGDSGPRPGKDGRG